ncbi:MAG: FUSC family protein [Sphingobacteriales bacterium 17-39-43]|uniref:FUSC family protein n=1 Tax=Daejeonella sp. TaxID=2805397 RepID=UPI000BC3A765|nr:FUSC family membrane protein [Daejeonella sp.]MCF8453865.1 FUSC family protein [Pedobacter sp.]OYZ32898.1 MAG: FUSC family protein [Sphingobacteriales bacterium 16-39-50]OZA26308.1 MAG: FUSC family protein [Sphingobacteriales bacterium 17-39-43]HQT23521.1 FUSC family membrane protein [Daejeonella sp.]HQT56164.1 FUSC family membrane protein [Daejeonella sp.]
MRQSREIKTFIFSQYFSEGLRITFGVLLPSLVFFHLDQLEVGLTISLGAVCVSIADNQGPINHKRNGMLFCSIFVFLTTLLTGFINKYPILLGLEIIILCFFYSMFSVYGNRASSIGTAALLVMILSIDHDVTASEGAVGHALYILTGGIWYMILSLSLSQIRPYRLAQQAMGECIREVAEYVRLKADFYDEETDFDENYRKLISQQVIVHEQQDSVRELLFKTRLKVKESTLAGRLLILVFVDIVDLFEQTMATHYDYLTLHKTFGKSNSLKEFKSIIIKLSEELENLSYYIISNEIPQRLYDFKYELERLKKCIDLVEESGTNAFVLKKILINVRNMVSRVDKIYTYFNQKQLTGQEIKNEVDLSKFVSHQKFDFKILKENLSPKSSIFRHSIRVALMCFIGFLVSKLFPVGYHSYWILLTILVLLKPAYSLTKQRNIERLIGTIIGAVVGALILIFIKDQTALFIFLLLFMVAAYSFQRLNYIVSVLFMTPYILILFSFLGESNLNIAQERIIDTFIGSFIALSASYLVLPNWESHQFKDFMREVLIANYQYLQKVAIILSGGTIDITAYKLARKNVYVNSANLGSAFQRMLSEPKSKQQNSKELHKFVVLNHMLSSYTATLITNLQQINPLIVNDLHIKLIRRSLYTLSEVIKSMKDVELEEIEINIPDTKSFSKSSNEEDLLTEQLELVNKLILDLQKLIQNQISKEGMINQSS